MDRSPSANAEGTGSVPGSGGSARRGARHHVPQPPSSSATTTEAERLELVLHGRGEQTGGGAGADFHQFWHLPGKDLLLLVLFLWVWGFHFSSTTAGGDRDWLEAMLFSLSAVGTKGTVCFPEVPQACPLTRREREHASEGKPGLWDAGLGSNPGSLDNYLMPAKLHFYHVEE